MCGNEVIGIERQQVIETAQQHAWVAVLLAADGEDVEQQWPHEVVYAHAKRREPVGDRIVGIGGCVGDFNGEARHGDGGIAGERVGCRDVAVAKRSVRGIAIEVAETHVDNCVFAN